jgi:hypothetical protein
MAIIFPIIKEEEKMLKQRYLRPSLYGWAKVKSRKSPPNRWDRRGFSDYQPCPTLDGYPYPTAMF